MIFSGEKINSKTALAYGLVGDIIENNKLFDYGLKEMKRLTSNSSLATKIAKKSIDEGYDLDIKSALNIEFREYIKTLDSKERLNALKKYRK